MTDAQPDLIEIRNILTQGTALPQKMGEFMLTVDPQKGLTGSLLWIHELDVFQPYPLSALASLQRVS